LLLINSTEQNLQGGVRWREFSMTSCPHDMDCGGCIGLLGSPRAVHTSSFFYSFFLYTTNFGRVKARYFRNGSTKIYQIYKKFFKHPLAQIKGKVISKFWGGGQGETQLENKMNLEKLKSYQNIWIFFIVKCCFYIGLNIIFKYC